MHEPNFWTASAEAMEMSIEGKRLIAAKIADLLRNAWRRCVIAAGNVMDGLGKHGHLPPV